MRHPAAFFIGYLIALLPTYVLPYLGSNSFWLADSSTSTAFWLHFTAIYAMVILAWMRGVAIGRNWLPALPAIAGLFEFVPGLNWVPLVPTAFHVTTLIMGVNRGALEGKGLSGKKLAASGFGLMMLLLVAVIEIPTSKSASPDAQTLAGAWALADTGCATDYGATYTEGGRFVEGDAGSGIEGRWSIDEGVLVRANELEFTTDDWLEPPVVNARDGTDRFPIVELTEDRLVFEDDQSRRYSYIRCHEGQRSFMDGEVATAS